jgi:hypothetical protein
MHYLTYLKKLRKLERERDKELETLTRLAREAEKEGGRDAGLAVWQTEDYELKNLDFEITLLKTQFLRSPAERLSLPFPKFSKEDGFREQGRYDPRWYLTNEGIVKVRSQISAERRERMEILYHWAILAVGLIGA